MRVRFSPDALFDVDSLRNHIAHNGDGVIAERIVDRIGSVISTLAQFPHLGRDGRVPGTSEMVVPRIPFLIVYRVDLNEQEHELIVLRVYHAAQDRHQQ